MIVKDRKSLAYSSHETINTTANMSEQLTIIFIINDSSFSLLNIQKLWQKLSTIFQSSEECVQAASKDKDISCLKWHLRLWNQPQFAWKIAEGINWLSTWQFRNESVNLGRPICERWKMIMDLYMIFGRSLIRYYCLGTPLCVKICAFKEVQSV